MPRGRSASSNFLHRDGVDDADIELEDFRLSTEDFRLGALRQNFTIPQPTGSNHLPAWLTEDCSPIDLSLGITANETSLPSTSSSTSDPSSSLFHPRVQPLSSTLIDRLPPPPPASPPNIRLIPPSPNSSPTPSSPESRHSSISAATTVRNNPVQPPPDNMEHHDEQAHDSERHEQGSNDGNESLFSNTSQASLTSTIFGGEDVARDNDLRKIRKD